MKDVFKFPHFTVRQERTAMKVGTDGVLLGQEAQMPEGGTRVLDIGTGTGLLALMMADRFPHCHVDAIDIDADACSQARENVEQNGFADRVSVLPPCALQDFSRQNATQVVPVLYDAIVCNPPYFSNSLHSPNAKRTLARHADSLSYADLARSVKTLLAPEGLFSVIIPSQTKEDLLAECYIAGLSIHRQTGVRTAEHKPVKRWILTLGRQVPEEMVSTTVTLG